MAKVTTTLDAVDIQRAKWAQQLTNKASSDMVSLMWFYTDSPHNLISIFVWYSTVPVHRFGCKGESSFHPRIWHSKHGPCQKNESHLQWCKSSYSSFPCFSFLAVYQSTINMPSIKSKLECLKSVFSSLRTNTKNSMRRWSTGTQPLLIHLSWSVPRNPTSSPVMWVCSLVYVITNNNITSVSWCSIFFSFQHPI